MRKKVLTEYENPKAWGIVRDLCHQIESGQLDDKIPEIMDEINNFTPPTETRYLWVNCYEESCDMDRELMKSLERRINKLKLNENMKKNKIRLTEPQLHKIIKESVKRALREGIEINDDEINEMGIMRWFDNYAPIGYSLEVVNGDGNRAYHLYDEKKELLGSWDDVDGFLSNSGFFN